MKGAVWGKLRKSCGGAVCMEGTGGGAVVGLLPRCMGSYVHWGAMCIGELCALGSCAWGAVWWGTACVWKLCGRICMGGALWWEAAHPTQEVQCGLGCTYFI